MGTQTKSAEWYERRKRVIGGSDIAAVLGVDRYRSAADIWLEKTGRLDPKPGTEDTDRGDALEPAALDMFERRRGVKLARKVYVRRGLFGAELDGAIPLAGSELAELSTKFPTAVKEYSEERSPQVEAVVEAKSASVVTRETEEPDSDLLIDPGWGPNPEDVPFRVICQGHVQMYTANCRVCWVPVFTPAFGRFRFDVKVVAWSDNLMQQIHDAAGEFWRCVESDTRPPDVSPTLDALKRQHRRAGEIKPLDDDDEAVVAIWQRIREERLTIEKREGAVYRDAVAVLGDAEEGMLPSGQRLTYFSQFGGKHVDHADLEAELAAIQRRMQTWREMPIEQVRAEMAAVDLPAVLAKHTTQGQHRVLRAPKMKKGKR
jgi:putative phage-type endonuclease